MRDTLDDIVTDLKVLFSECVVCYEMTNTTHHTHQQILSTNNQSLDLQNSKSCVVKRNFKHLDCGMFYRTHCINTHVVNKLVLHLRLYVILRYLFIIVAMALFVVLTSSVSLLPASPPNNRISDRKYSTCLILTFSNRGSPDRCQSKLGRVKSLLTHLTTQENLAWQSLESSDNRVLADFGRKGKIRPKISLIIL